MEATEDILMNEELVSDEPHEISIKNTITPNLSHNNQVDIPQSRPTTSRNSVSHVLATAQSRRETPVVVLQSPLKVNIIPKPSATYIQPKQSPTPTTSPSLPLMDTVHHTKSYTDSNAEKSTGNPHLEEFPLSSNPKRDDSFSKQDITSKNNTAPEKTSKQDEITSKKNSSKHKSPKKTGFSKSLRNQALDTKIRVADLKIHIADLKVRQKQGTATVNLLKQFEKELMIQRLNLGRNLEQQRQQRQQLQQEHTRENMMIAEISEQSKRPVRIINRLFVKHIKERDAPKLDPRRKKPSSDQSTIQKRHQTKAKLIRDDRGSLYANHREEERKRLTNQIATNRNAINVDHREKQTDLTRSSNSGETVPKRHIHADEARVITRAASHAHVTPSVLPNKPAELIRVDQDGGLHYTQIDKLQIPPRILRIDEEGGLHQLS